MFFLFNFFYSIFKGKKAEQNPWESNTLEWSTPVEHLHGNWPGEIPTVYRGPYEYSRPDREEDFFPQYIPDEKAPETAAQEGVVEPVETNIIVFSVQSHIKDQEVIEMLKQKGIAISLLAKGKLRIVTHLDYRQVMHEYVLEALDKLSF